MIRPQALGQLKPFFIPLGACNHDYGSHGLGYLEDQEANRPRPGNQDFLPGCGRTHFPNRAGGTSQGFAKGPFLKG
jgi:hypothetical protein